MSAWVRSVSSSQTVYVGVKNYGKTEVKTSAKVGTTYTKISPTFTTGPTATSAEIFLWKDATGTVYVDDWTLS